jgi:hypothetical protein
MDAIVPALTVSAIATIAFLLAVWLLARARAWLGSWLALRIERRVELGAQEFAWLLRAARATGQLLLLVVIVVLA